MTTRTANLDIARDLERAVDLNPARGPVRRLVDMVADANVYALTLGFDLELNFDGPTVVSDLVRNLDRAHVHAREFDPYLLPDSELARILDRVRIGAREFFDPYLLPDTDLAGRAFDRDPASIRGFVGDRVGDLVGVLGSALEYARQLAVVVSDDGEGTVDTPAGQRAEVAVARSATHLVAFVSRILPWANRDRYTEEFGAELWDLAEAGAGWWRQIGHTARLLTRAWGLRRELKTPRSRKVSS